MTDLRGEVSIGVALSYAMAQMKKLDGTFRSWAEDTLVEGESIAAVDPVTGETFGHATKAKSTWQAYVGDESLLMAHLQEVDPEALLDVDELAVSVDEVIAVLKQSHPEMVRQRVVIRDQTLNGLIKRSEAEKKPVAPGIEVVRKAGSMRVYPDKDKPDVITGFIRSGAVPLTYVEPAELTEGDQQ